MPAGCADDCSECCPCSWPREWPHADCTDSPGTLKALVIIQWVLVLALVIGAVVCVGICACVRRERAREQTLTQEQAPAMVPEKGTAK